VSEAVLFYRRAFDASELYRNTEGGGVRVVHCELLVGGARITLHEEFLEFGLPTPETLGGTPVSLNLYIPDVDAVFARAIAAGGAPIAQPTDRFWGARSGALLDPFGHRWVLSTVRRDPSPDEIVELSRGVTVEMQLSAAGKRIK
jgi:PhnB protein